MQNFSSRLEQAIARSGKPKGKLAARCGVALSTVSRWLGGAEPKREMLEKIAEFLEVDAFWLQTGVTRPAEMEAESSESSVVREEPMTYNAKPIERETLNSDRLETALERIAGALERLAYVAEKFTNEETP